MRPAQAHTKALISGRTLLAALAAGLMILSVSACASLTTQTGPRKLTIQRLWARDTEIKPHVAYRWMHRMTPLVLERLVIQGNNIDSLTAFDRESGAMRWRLALENGVEGGVVHVGGRLYFGANNGQFYCVDVTNGKIIWTFPVRAETLAPPTVADGVVYFQSGADTLFALDAASGKQVWFYNRQTSAPITIRATTQPVISGDLLYAGFSDGYLVAFKKSDGSLTWERKLNMNPRFKDVDSTPVFDERNMYVAGYDGQLYALRKDTGNVVWQLEHGSYTPVTLVGDRLYFATTDGQVMALESESGSVIWSRTVGSGIATQPNYYKGYLVYGVSDGPLVVADAATGKTVTSFSPGRGLFAMPAVSDETGEIFFISNNSILWKMRLAWVRSSELLPWQK